MTPVEEHGASTRMRSKGRWPSQKRGVTGIAGEKPRTAPQPLRFSAIEHHAGGIEVDGGHVRAITEQLEQVAGLAARSRAGIQHPHARASA